MDGRGYVRVDELLRWHKLRSMGVRMEELVGVVEENEKKRFGLLWVGSGDGNGSSSEKEEEGEGEGEEGGGANAAEATGAERTQRALQHAAAGDLDPSHYLIRAVQGHSLKTIEADAYLRPITLADAAAGGIPDTVVHGTFYAAWPRILASGGLKSMSRVHVHFATGPAKDHVLARL